jgi:DSF synthase
MSSTATFKQLPLMNSHLQQAHYHVDDDLGAATFYMQPEPRPCFNSGLLHELRSFQQAVARKVLLDTQQKGESALKYTVLASSIPGIFNLGGDLNLFLQLIQQQDRGSLQQYAISCIDIVHQMSVSLESPLTTIALIQGSAQGGGLEAALSCNVIIAERGTQLGFPEVLFNLFPGMGAYSFLRQRVNSSLAEHIILSGKLYSAEELHRLRVVDIIAEPGKGDQALQEYIRQTSRRNNAQRLIRHTRNSYNQVPYQELHDITSMWVDCAMNISERELRTMHRLVRAQNNKIKNMNSEQELSTAK